MTIRNLEYLLKPRSIALVGASTRPGSVGLITARNLRAGGFAGPVWLVNPKYRSIRGRIAIRQSPRCPLHPTSKSSSHRRKLSPNWSSNSEPKGRAQLSS